MRKSHSKKVKKVKKLKVLVSHSKLYKSNTFSICQRYKLFYFFVLSTPKYLFDNFFLSAGIYDLILLAM